MARTPKHLQLAAARARAARAFYRIPRENSNPEKIPEPEGSPEPRAASPIVVDLVSDDEFSDESECGYDGGVNHYLTSDYVPESDSDGEFTEEDLSDFDEEMLEGLQKEMAQLKEPTPFECLLIPKSTKAWKKTEQNRSLGYNGQGRSTRFRKDKQARDLATARAEAKKSLVIFYWCNQETVTHLLTQK